MKKRGMKKRVLAALMTACMVVGSVPGVSLADVSGEPSGTLTPAGMRSTASGITSTQHPTREHLAQCLRTPQHRTDIR